MPGRAERSITTGAWSGDDPSAAPLELRVLAEQVRMLYARAPVAQATVVVNAAVVSWIFRRHVPPALSIAWLATLWALAALRMRLVLAYRRRDPGPLAARAWARRFAAEAILTGICWGAGALVFYEPRSPLHQVFLVFVLGGMTAGAALSNASYGPAFLAFTAPALPPMVLRLIAEREPVHAAMAFMLALFGLAMAWISRSGGRAIEEAIRLRLRNEALLEGLTSAQERLERLNAELERRVGERTGELERMLALRIASETKERQAHEALLESDRRKNQFLAVLSHELRNPLAPIRNCLYLLDRAAPGSEAAATALDIIRRQSVHLGRLVDDLLDVTRISRGKVELRRVRVDVSEVMRRACDDQRASFGDRGVELRLALSGPVWVDADETRVTQVIGNLLQNAAKFSRRGGTVIASVDEAGGEATLRVRDDGIGIAPELLPLVFEPFVQADEGLARSQGGLGLGLALARSLVELHGGRISAHSEGPGRGSEFVVSLPLAPALPRPEPTLARPASSQ